MRGALNSQKPLRPSFQIKLNGEPVAIATVGQASARYWGAQRFYNRVIQTVWHTDRFATDEPSIFSRDVTVAAVLTALGKRGVVFLNPGVALAS